VHMHTIMSLCACVCFVQVMVVGNRGMGAVKRSVMVRVCVFVCVFVECA